MNDREDTTAAALNEQGHRELARRDLALAVPGLPARGQSSGMQGIEQHANWSLLSRLPLRLTASVALPRFCVGDLLRLRIGQVVESAWPIVEDVPLRLGKVQLSMTAFEVVEQRLAVRLTRLV